MLNNLKIHFLLLSYMSRFNTCFYGYKFKSKFRQNIKNIILKDELNIIK